MILADYFKSKHDSTWDFALQCGVNKGVIRLPEDKDFDITDFSHWKTVHKNFTDFGIKPIIIEPLPNELHDHIKAGDKKRDECIEKAIKMLEYMNELDIRTVCFNWMAHIGWLRTSDSVLERGNALVTGFDMKDFTPTDKVITAQQLWNNYEYFIKAVIPYAEKYGIPFLPNDFKKRGGFLRSTELSKELGLYRQDYCGCVFSKPELTDSISGGAYE